MYVDAVNEFQELYGAYNQGLYTKIEMVSKTMELLDEGDEGLWQVLPEEVKREIRSVVLSFSEEDEIVSFSSEDAAVAKARLISLKRWLGRR